MRRVAWGVLLWGSASLAAQEEIDRAVAAKAGGPLAPRAPDAEFLRRVWLDLAGTIPSSDQARAFLDDRDPTKREKLVDRLLASPDFARRMEQAVTVMFLERRTGQHVPDAQWSDYLRKAFAANEPWDRVVRTVLGADGRAVETRPAMKFLADAAGADQHRMTNDVSRLLLGRNLLCAQCHDHPIIKEFKQAEYMGLFAYLHQTKVQPDPKTKKAVMVETAATGKVEFASVFSPGKKSQTGPRLPGGSEVEVPTFEKGKEYEVPPSKDTLGVPKFRPRELLAEALVTHPRFARNSVNRFWFLLMGRGLVHPLDLDHAANPPSHPELLDALVTDFREHGYDLRRLLRTIVLSEAYQRSSRRAEGPAPPAASYRAALMKPLSAEQLAWALMRATGNLEAVLGAPIPEASRFNLKNYLNGKGGGPSTLPDVLRFFAEIFGNAPGDPEVDFQPSMTHALFLMNERLVLDWLKPRGGNLVDRLSKLKAPDAVADELYLSVVTRRPEAPERAEVAAYLGKNAARREAALGELAWALLASAEFRLNH
jgi:hypothetical protein